MSDDGEALKVGFHPPLQCARGRGDCRSLAQIISSSGETFCCVGEAAAGTSPWPSDQWVFCHRSRTDRSGVAGVDVRFYVDRRDMSHLSAVLSLGLATVIPPDDEAMA